MKPLLATVCMVICALMATPSLADASSAGGSGSPSAEVSQDRKYPQVTPREIVDWGNGSLGNLSWAQGYSDGLITGVYATMVELKKFGLTTLNFCPPAGITNAQIQSTVRSTISGLTLSLYPNIDDYGGTAAIHIALALVFQYPCR